MPRPGADSISTAPPARATTSRTLASPRPVPRPGGLVVKNGSVARAAVDGSMPRPLSATSMVTSPLPRSGPTSRTRLPPPGMASRAFRARFSRAWPSTPAPMATGSDGTVRVSTVIPGGRTRASVRATSEATAAGRQRCSPSSGRPKASSCRAVCEAASETCWMSSRHASIASRLQVARTPAALARMTFSALRKSWAAPAASCPRAPSRCPSASAASARSRSRSATSSAIRERAIRSASRSSVAMSRSKSATNPTATTVMVAPVRIQVVASDGSWLASAGGGTSPPTMARAAAAKQAMATTPTAVARRGP